MLPYSTLVDNGLDKYNNLVYYVLGKQRKIIIFRTYPLRASKDNTVIDIINRMREIHRARKMAKYVLSFYKPDNKPSISDTLNNFCSLSDKYSEETARHVLGVCLRNEYLVINESRYPGDAKKLDYTGAAVSLMTFTGYINELAGSVGKIPPMATWAISLLALVVSILVAIYK